ncbi:hypothetical protein BMR1_02g03410 [Babesia microti strain RI]|uniref:Uncharacterized protein n=1 Tax=Babesia microti (strain RI) TaxID=1133968 RepID=I7JAL0_BABMR|nr:hypothetical protein BMR1_02g03410 [Babesia microti strain RI]CCF73834.1 hypothetical protein BMR1_02g03410 [Babesia microti strain RI]|eukprot:XP_012648443.1 hypothetical protein BMR1_02g03410 [Babesia microti strain RI]
MNTDYYKLILQFELSLIYWLTKYRLITTTDYVTKLIGAIEHRDSILTVDNSNNGVDLVEFFANEAVNENFKIKLFQRIIGKWMSIVSDWQFCDFKLTKNDYLAVKSAIGRVPAGLIGLCGDIALVSPFVHESDTDYESNRLINGGLVPFINYLSQSNVENEESVWIDCEMLRLYLLDGEVIWGKINNFLKKFQKINCLSQYITEIAVDTNIAKLIDSSQFYNVKQLLLHLKPFPTICYVVGSDTNKKISKLEGKGFITKYQALLDSNELLMENFVNENFHCLISRFILLHIDIIRCLYTVLVNSMGFKQIASELLNSEIMESDEDNSNKPISESCEVSEIGIITRALSILNTVRRYGIGGTDNWYRVKCLHSHYAYNMSFGLLNSVTLNFINSSE